MLIEKTQKNPTNHNLEIGKELSKILFDKNPFVRFVGEGNKTSFGIIVECDEYHSYPNFEIIVCVPKPFLEEFMSLPKQHQDVRKIISNKSPIKRLLSPFSSQQVPLVDFGEDVSSIKIMNVEHQSLPDDPYGFVRIKISKETKFSVCEKYAIFTEKAIPLPLFLTHLADNFPKSKNKVFSTSNFIKSADTKNLGFVITASGGISSNSLGSPVFDRQGLYYGMITEITNDTFTRCVTMESIFQSFFMLYKIKQ